MTIESLAQKAEADKYIELFVLDATALGDAIYRMTPNANGASAVLWGGNTFAAIPCEAVGWTWDGQGPLATPTFRVANAGLGLTAAILAADDFRGASLTRYRTFARFLDGGAEPSTDDIFPPDVYRVNRKRLHTKALIEWELASVLEQLSIYIPRRVILKNACSHIYRVWNGSAFVYTKATCPYTGTPKFTQAGVSTTNPALDVCGKRLSDCVKRFGANPLPTRAFPGVAEVAR